VGTFCLVLHTHLPYLKHNGVWPSGEDLFHQAASESYLPLLEVFGRLADRGMTDACTLGVSPMVGHQLADDHMLDELGWFLGRYEPRAVRNAVMYEGQHRDEIRALAGFYATWARQQAETLDAQVASHGDLRAAFSALADHGLIELLGGPLTHPLMPETHASLGQLQMRLGREAFPGKDWHGIWLPECHYRPGVEGTLSDAGVTHLVVDGPTMIRSGGDTIRPRLIAESDIVAFARDLDTTYKVWSPTGGYPSGKWYRDFFHYDIEAGFKDWRVTSTQKPLHEKRPYEPEAALAAARKDATDFAAHIVRTLDERTTADDPDPVIVAAYDTELFGHWWFEGPTFLEALLLELADSPIRVSTLDAERQRREIDRIELAEGSWGFRKDLRSWIAPETQYMHDTLQTVEAETVRALETDPPSGARAAALEQAVREAMLLRSSDWPFLVLRGRNPEYAWERFHSHHTRWKEMMDLSRARIPDDLIWQRVDVIFQIDDIAADLALS
jgi:1,4-alpha-glucan branching enzyme